MIAHDMLNLRNMLMAAFLVLLPFQDVGLKHSPLGVLGVSLSIVPLVCLVGLSFVSWLYSTQWRISWTLMGVAAYLVVLNTISLLRFGSNIMGVNVISKSLAISVITFLWVYVIFGIEYLALPNFVRYVRIAFFILIAGIALSDLNAGHLGFLVNNGIFHATENSDLRWRGLASEASLLAPLVINLGWVAAQYSERTYAKVLFGVSAVVIQAISGSKGGVLALLLTCLLLVLTGGFPVKTLLKCSLLALPILALALFQLTVVSSAEILQESTTAATRSTMALWGVRNVIANPLGLGVAGYYWALAKSVPAAMDTVYINSPIPLNFSEVESYAVSPENASSKVFVLNSALFYGLPLVMGLVYTLWSGMRVLTAKRHFFLIAAVSCTAFELCSSVDLPTAYGVFFVFGVALNEARRTKTIALAEGARTIHNAA